MSQSVKQFIKSSPVAQRLLTVPLHLRRKYLVSKFRPAFEAMSRLSQSTQQDIQIFVPEFGGTFALSPKSSLFQRCMIYGAYEPAVSRMFFDHIDASRDVIDVGANIGFYTIGAALRLGSGRVLSIEPTASAYGRLQRNVETNAVSAKVMLEKALVGDAAGECSISVVDGREEYSSIGGLVNPSVAHVAAQEVAREIVPIRTLDSLVTKYGLSPNLIKIDVEGAEYKVLRGATDTLSRFRPFVMAECSDVMLAQQGSSSLEIRELLKTLGYRIINPEAPRVPFGKTISGDIFGIPDRAVSAP
ncbi:MAG: hypothetical protein QOF42_1562 [Gammaproteobacteria bacterium]|jgi:FkbM family methyltransferase|nr:hypothetical protein [Gammaproteobacteria bacterium]